MKKRILALAALAALGLSATSTSVAAEVATSPLVTPVILPDGPNQTCDSVASYLGEPARTVLYETMRVNTPVPEGENDFDVQWYMFAPTHQELGTAVTGYYVQVITDATGTVVSFTSFAPPGSTPIPVNAAIVKGSQEANVYIYEPGVAADQGLVSPDAGGSGDPAALSNITFCGWELPEDEEQDGTLEVIKFYDANANGINDDAQPITGWKISVNGTSEYTPYQDFEASGDYTVSEFSPIETNWYPTTTTSVNVTVDPEEDELVEFGNLCLGGGGGLTLGFWSNRNGKALFGTGDLAAMVALNLRKADGLDFNPASYSAFRTWILSATATNMAYMLSAQLAAMELNVFNGFVDGTDLIYAPGTMSANALGYATVNAVMAEANASLGLDGLTPSGDPNRAVQEALKNALDNANNNRNFVQATPCPFSFAPDPEPVV